MGFKTSFLRRRAYLPKGETSCEPSELSELLKAMRKSSEDQRKKEIVKKSKIQPKRLIATK